MQFALSFAYPCLFATGFSRGVLHRFLPGRNESELVLRAGTCKSLFRCKKLDFVKSCILYSHAGYSYRYWGLVRLNCSHINAEVHFTKYSRKGGFAHLKSSGMKAAFYLTEGRTSANSGRKPDDLPAPSRSVCFIHGLRPWSTLSTSGRGRFRSPLTRLLPSRCSMPFTPPAL